MFDDPSICKDDACPIGSTVVGSPHSIDTEGCSTGQLLGTVTAEFSNLLQAIGRYTNLLNDQVSPDTNYRPNVEALKTASDRVLILVQQLLPFLPGLDLPAAPHLQNESALRARPTITPSFEQYLRFWLGHGNSIFVASLSNVSHLEMIVSPQVSINARSTLGQFRFRVQDNTVEKL